MGSWSSPRSSCPTRTATRPAPQRSSRAARGRRPSGAASSRPVRRSRSSSSGPTRTRRRWAGRSPSSVSGSTRTCGSRPGSRCPCRERAGSPRPRALASHGPRARAALGGRIGRALVEAGHTEIMYHLARPGHELVYLQRVLHAWGIDGHNSHTNVCSSSARAGYAFWHGMDRPSPDHANARFILLLSSHLESGHYFNPHAQRIIEAKMRGAKVAVIDSRLSNTASMADYWLSPWPGTEAAILLAMARILVSERLYDRAFVEKWTNWEEYLREERPDLPVTFDAFHRALEELYAPYTPEFAAEESGVAAAAIVEIARAIGAAGSALATHIWRNTAAGNLGGWQVARALELLVGLMGAE